MVTGVETAGLVLATIPLIICALEHYESAIGSTKAFLHWKGNLSKATSELYVLHAAYDQTLRVLLIPVTSKEDLVSMVDDTTSALWTQGEIAEDLKTYLGPAIMREIESIATNLLEIIKHLNIAGAQQSSQQNLHTVIQANPLASSSPDPRRRFFFRERIKFTMKRQNLKERMNVLNISITRLTDFAQRAEKLDNSPPKQRCKVKFSAPLKAIEMNACRVHKVLLSSWCQSHASHRAGILLEERILRRKRGSQMGIQTSEPVGSATRFVLCLDEHRPNTGWLTTEFHLNELTECTESTVTFTITSFTPPASNTPVPPTQYREIIELCSYLQQRTDPAVKFRLDGSQKLHAYPGDSDQGLNTPKEITLAQIIPQLPQKLANGDIYRLCIKLAASVLQLIQTPWLNQAWNKSAILFTRHGSNMTGNVDIKHPFLIADFVSSANATPPINTSPALRERTSLLSLGIMLLEISSGQSLESVRKPQHLGSNQTPSYDSDLITATEWLHRQEAQGSLSYGFVTAITSCLQVYLNPRANFNDPEFCQHIQETVIMPLEEEMQYLLYGPNF